MKVKNILIACIILFGISGCSKTDDTQPAPSSPASCGSSTTITPCSGTSYYAILSLNKNGNVSGGSVTNYTSGQAYFSISSKTWEDPNSGITVDTVRLNNVVLKMDAFYHVYFDTTNSAGSYPANWKISGNNGIPSFTYTDNQPEPVFTGYNLLPDTILKSQGTSFQITGISNANSVTVTTFDFNGQMLLKTCPVSGGTINITSAELFAFTSGGGAIQVGVIRDNVQNVYGKLMCFRSTYYLTKSITLQ